MKILTVDIPGKSYPVIIGEGNLHRAGEELLKLGFKRCVVITNPVVKGLYGDTLDRPLEENGIKANTLVVPDGEEQKSLENASRLYSQLDGLAVDRTTPILALGGGVIGDLAGFVAATYLRGLPLVQLPTTLVGQVDSSLGGKVAVNYGGLKNRIGTFYQPKLVLSDITTLTTLPRKEFVNGLAEVIKSAVIADKDFFCFLEDNLSQLIDQDPDTLEEVVFRTARIKASIVSKDEYDFGIRHLLNFGHTFGHAIESVSEFKIAHGEAVGIGMVMAAKLSLLLGFFSRDDLERLEGLIRRAGLPTKLPPLNKKEIIRVLTQDKKVEGGKLKFVLLGSLGEAFVSEIDNTDAVREIVETS